MSWEEKEMVELIDFYNNQRVPLSGIERSKIQGKYPYYGAQGIVDYIDKYIFDGKYILVAEDGENLRSRNQDIARFANGKFWVNNHAHIIRGKKDICDDYFLKSTLNSIDIGGYVTGAAQPKLSMTNLRRIKINLPPLQTQKRIADILSTYDDLIENNLKRIKLLEQAAQNIYKEWFVNLRFPGYENTPINEETGLPLGWEEKSASDLFDIKGGTQPPKSQWSDDKKDGYVRMVQIRDYKTDTHIAYVKDDKKLRRCGKEDIMIARYGASVGRICWGIDGVYNVALAKAIPYDNAYLEYIRWYVKSYFFQESLLGMTQRAAQDGFNKDTFKSLTAIIPTINVVTKFDNIVYPMLKQMELLKNKNQKLKSARDILLPRLMNRTIEV